jgi:hypothetical protein
MISKKGHPAIWGGFGNDTIKANNGKADLIRGGGQYDTAVIDKFDAYDASVERCRPTRLCQGRRVLLASHELSALSYPSYHPRLQCTIDPSGRRQITFTAEPIIRAADSTPHTDWQTVAWSAKLFSWNGSQWIFLGPRYQTTWLWDYTRDTQYDGALGFLKNYWRRFDTGQRWSVWFDLPGPGYYRVAVWYHWYATPTAEAHDVYVWAHNHGGDFQDPQNPGQNCYFPS